MMTIVAIKRAGNWQVESSTKHQLASRNSARTTRNQNSDSRPRTGDYGKVGQSHSNRERACSVLGRSPLLSDMTVRVRGSLSILLVVRAKAWQKSYPCRPWCHQC
jgi:hypothetical protein